MAAIGRGCVKTLLNLIRMGQRATIGFQWQQLDSWRPLPSVSTGNMDRIYHQFA